MDSGFSKLDLKLWLNKELIQRQNRLKAQFWDLFAQVGNELETERLSQIHSKSKGVKLSKGGDLLGYPYQVLDVIRDFDPDKGLNFRVLNWYGHGIYLFVHFGKLHPKALDDFFLENNFEYCLSTSPWDYPDLILNDLKTNSPTPTKTKSMKYHQWLKKIDLDENSREVKKNILTELKNLMEFFLYPVR